MTRYTTLQDLAALFALVEAEIARKGAGFYGWVNAPGVKNGVLTHTTGWGDKTETREISVGEALSIYKGKLEGAYGERFAITMALLAGLIRHGKKVALLQVHEEPNAPFDAQGWVVVSIEGYPLFHLSPEDLPMAKVAELGLITVVVKGSDEERVHAWKSTNKVQELSMLLDWML